MNISHSNLYRVLNDMIQVRFFFFQWGVRKKKKQKHQHTCTYKHLRNMLMITAHALKKDLTCVTCYLVFSSQPSSRPWIISMLFLILSYTTEIKQFSAAWILKWKQHSVISPLIYYSIFTNDVLHKLFAIKSENVPVAVLCCGTCI